MANALCKSCGEHVHVSLRRGMKLKELRHTCGGQLASAFYHHDGRYVERTKENLADSHAAAQRAHELRRQQAAAIVATGKCPQCGSAIMRNTSLSGWWQCEQYGAEEFRARPQEPACNWQTFTN